LVFDHWTILRAGEKVVLKEMGCPALGIWVGFLKQPALPGEAPQKKFFIKNSKE
jgi:hypothetical protein